MDATAVVYGEGAQQRVILIQLAGELVVRSIQLQFHARSSTSRTRLKQLSSRSSSKFLSITNE